MRLESKNDQPIRVAIIGSMAIGIHVLDLLLASPNVVVCAASFPSKETVWWDDIVDHDELAKRGVLSVTPEEVFQCQPDLVFSIMNSYIFSTSQIDSATHGIINLHPAPLPSYRGVKTIPHAIINGELSFGAAVHLVEAGIDSGGIIEQVSFDIDDDVTAIELFELTMKAATRLLSDVVPNILDEVGAGGSIRGVPQNTSQYRYYSAADSPVPDLNAYQPEMRNVVIRAFTFPPHMPAFEVDAAGNQRFFVIDRVTREPVPSDSRGTPSDST